MMLKSWQLNVDFKLKLWLNKVLVMLDETSKWVIAVLACRYAALSVGPEGWVEWSSP